MKNPRQMPLKWIIGITHPEAAPGKQLYKQDDPLSKDERQTLFDIIEKLLSHGQQLKVTYDYVGKD